MSRARVAMYALPAPRLPPPSRSTSAEPVFTPYLRTATLSSTCGWHKPGLPVVYDDTVCALAARDTRTCQPVHPHTGFRATGRVRTRSSRHGSAQHRDPAIDELPPRCKTSRPRQLAVSWTEQLHGYSTQYSTTRQTARQPAIPAARRRVHYTKSGVNLAYRTPRQERTGASRRAPRFDLDGRTFKKQEGDSHGSAKRRGSDSESGCVAESGSRQRGGWPSA
ncbi:hypothetical protein OH76DRAFT_1408273, partial [Lentinus brumalis]